ncbi:MAG: class I SAM-dependent methyltransferase [Candidatus Stygibacter frigidus]|nr:class I SAM-dependent methyltransferase [Candidatus Stygibacter frigidus]
MSLRKWLKKHFAYNTAKIMDQTAYRYLSDCRNVIDIGCGSGNFIKHALEKISGIDNNPEAVRWCKQQGLNVISGDALDLPFEAESYDGQSSHRASIS